MGPLAGFIAATFFIGGVNQSVTNMSVPLTPLESLVVAEVVQDEEKDEDDIERPVEAKVEANNEVLCSCVKYARGYIPDIPPIYSPDDLQPNTYAQEGVAVLFDYNLPHIAVVTEVLADGVMIKEANFHKCKESERFVSFVDVHLRGFYSPYA